MEITVPGLKQEIGLGDAIERATSSVGIQPCGGCKQRKAWANGLRLVPRASEWTAPPEVPPGWSIARMSNGVNPTRVMFEYRAHADAEPSKWIVWDIIDGAYRNSHSACCNAGGEMAVLEEYERRIR